MGLVEAQRALDALLEMQVPMPFGKNVHHPHPGRTVELIEADLAVFHRNNLTSEGRPRPKTKGAEEGRTSQPRTAVPTNRPQGESYHVPGGARVNIAIDQVPKNSIEYAWVSTDKAIYSMGFVPKFFRKKEKLCHKDLAKPYQWRAKKAVLTNDLTKAIAYLNRGIALAPELLVLYLERAQILQYGLHDYSRALEDYQHILRELEKQPDEDLAGKCKQGMRDMMTAE